MDNAQKKHLVETLERCATRLREARLPGEVAAALERLAGQVDQPCVLAVVGRMKAGKSTFVNALLGEDVAKVGSRETTATINHFRYGNPADPDRPVRCRLRSGADEYVSVAFLESLQGSTVESLRRADDIEYLEYLLPNPYLRDVTLVDTPGTGAVVQDHQNRTAEFLNLQNQLRDRHAEATLRIGSEADAVIYLVGAVPRSSDQTFLDDFSQATGGTSQALNAIGVMAKVDVQPEILARRMTLAAKMSEQLKDSLNTVVPVSAGIYRALKNLQENDNQELIRWMTTLRTIPAKRLEKLLGDDELYLGDYDDGPTVEEREKLLGQLDWGVFATVAQLAADPALSEQAIVEHLEELAGFGPLHTVLERHFFQRARFLRCYRIAHDARNIVNDIRYRHLPKFRKQDRAEKDQRDRFLGFVRSANGDPAVAEELTHFLSLQCGTAARADRLEATVADVGRQLASLFHEMLEYNADFAAWEELDGSRQLFSPAEIDELRALLGLHGVELEKRLPAGNATTAYASERQQAWNDTSQRAREPIRRRVAERAQARYGLILYDMTKSAD